MISNDLRSSCRALLIGAYQDGGGGGNSGEWVYPESWLPLPEPDTMGMNLIITTQNPISNFDKAGLEFLCDSPDSNIKIDTEIDWGDGNVETISVPTNRYYDVSHTYTAGTGHMAGDFEQFLIKLRCFNYREAEPRIFTFMPGTQIQAIKVGNSMKVGTNNTAPMSSPVLCKYIKSGDINTVQGAAFYSVERFEYTGPPLTEIRYGTFQNWNLITDENLIGIDFSKITSFGDRSFMECHSLFKHGLNAPNCTYVDEYAFSGDYSLNSVKLAENCTFGNGAFANCYSLYDNPAYPKTQS